MSQFAAGRSAQASRSIASSQVHIDRIRRLMMASECDQIPVPHAWERTKMNLRNSSGFRLNPQICSKCGTVNHQTATMCTKCSCPFPPSEELVVTGIEPSWPLWTWGLALVLFAGTAITVLIVSLLPTTPDPAIESRSSEVAAGLMPTQIGRASCRERV